MQRSFLIVLTCGLLAGCGQRINDTGSAQDTSGNGVVYDRGGGKDDHQRAMENATDTRPRGGSKAGAGGAGPGYDGTGTGRGEQGTVPGPRSGMGNSMTTNAATATNQSRSNMAGTDAQPQ